ncbi:MAG: hypothetical protein HOE90_17580 [Bacteriovoracaceae bacterium]|jgi:hypothetical protein|nr:hypothetical protein [Bacteriovoracaceae bacterium]
MDYYYIFVPLALAFIIPSAIFFFTFLYKKPYHYDLEDLIPSDQLDDALLKRNISIHQISPELQAQCEKWGISPEELLLGGQVTTQVQTPKKQCCKEELECACQAEEGDLVA